MRIAAAPGAWLIDEWHEYCIVREMDEQARPAPPYDLHRRRPDCGAAARAT
jgi:hypothetical protein